MVAVEWLFVYNVIFDYLLLNFIEQIFHTKIVWWRKWLAICSSAFIATLLVDTVYGGIISFFAAAIIAFGTTLDMFIRQSAILFLSSCLLGGVLTFMTTLFYVQSYIPLVVLLSIGLLSVLYRIWQWHLKSRAEQRYGCEVTLQLLDMTLHVKGYYDSGNSCYEPISGQPVHFLALNALPTNEASELIRALQEWDARRPTHMSMFPFKMRSYLRIIRLQTVQQNVLALAVRLNHISINDCMYKGHYIVITKDAQHFPQQASLIVHCSAKL